MIDLFSIISHTFCLLVVLSNLLSAKFVTLPFNISVPIGLLFYPLTFLLSDLVSEIFGPKQAKQMTITCLGMCLLSIVIIQIALILPTHSLHDQKAFISVLGLGGWRTVSSIIAFVIAQLVDIQLYALIKQWTGLRFLWLRNNGSTWVAQLIDTIIIDMLFLYLGMQMEMAQIVPIMLFSFCYKAFFSVANTPLLYLFVYLTRKRTNVWI